MQLSGITEKISRVRGNGFSGIAMESCSDRGRVCRARNETRAGTARVASSSARLALAGGTRDGEFASPEAAGGLEAPRAAAAGPGRGCRVSWGEAIKGPAGRQVVVT